MIMQIISFELWRRVLWAGLVVVACGGAPLAADFRESGEGLAWRRDVVREGPLSIHIVRIDRARNDLELLPTLGSGDQVGLNTLTTQLRLLPRDIGQPVAAINGDFYSTEHERFPGDPRGLFISRGELVSAPSDRDCFWLDAKGQPHAAAVRSAFSVAWPDGEITPLGLNEEPEDSPAVLYTPAAGPSLSTRGASVLTLEHTGEGPWLPLRIGETYQARVRSGARAGDTNTLRLALSPELRSRGRQLKPDSVLKISTRTLPNLKGTLTAIGGGPALVHEGRAQSIRAVKSNERHPRSALGWNPQYYFLVVVDGRQAGWSVGTTLPTLADYLVGLGCQEAINLDGGGSTELWLNGRILNRPCYGHERPTGTTLAIVRKASGSTNAAAVKPPVQRNP